MDQPEIGGIGVRCKAVMGNWICQVKNESISVKVIKLRKLGDLMETKGIGSKK
jgi:hypothetical protein